LLGCNIVVTEDPDEQLVSSETQIVIKPLPDFILAYDYWNNSMPRIQSYNESACGFLLSYAWLVPHRSDLDIAIRYGLLSKDIGLVNWVEILDGFFG
jgi:hypothetical protein